MKNDVYTKYHKTFSKKCILKNDFFVRTMIFLCVPSTRKVFQLFLRSLPNTKK